MCYGKRGDSHMKQDDWPDRLTAILNNFSSLETWGKEVIFKGEESRKELMSVIWLLCARPAFPDEGGAGVSFPWRTSTLNGFCSKTSHMYSSERTHFGSKRVTGKEGRWPSERLTPGWGLFTAATCFLTRMPAVLVCPASSLGKPRTVLMKAMGIYIWPNVNCEITSAVSGVLVLGSRLEQSISGQKPPWGPPWALNSAQD